ncbi:MAG: hypothetical protein AB7S81_08040 [Bdellovibrionales bacterium]
MLSLFPALLMFLIAAPALASNDMPSAPLVRPIHQKDGTLRMCLAKSTYEDQRLFNLALTPQEEVQIALKIPQGHFIKRHHYDVDLTLDQAEPRRIRAIAVSDETLLLKMGVNPAFKAQLATTQTLSIGTDTNKVLFRLPEMAPVLAQLESCAQIKKEPTKTLSIAPPPSQEPVLAQEPVRTQFAPPQPISVRQIEPVRQTSTEPNYLTSEKALAAFLQESGLPEVHMVPMGDIPQDQRVADYVWKTGGIMGGVQHKMAPVGTSIAKLAGLHLQGLRDKCQGTFRSSIGRAKVTANAQMRYAAARCAFPESRDKDVQTPPTVVVSLLFVLTKDGSFISFTHEGTTPYSDEIRRARNIIGTYLVRLDPPVQRAYGTTKFLPYAPPPLIAQPRLPVVQRSTTSLREAPRPTVAVSKKTLPEGEATEKVEKAIKQITKEEIDKEGLNGTTGEEIKTEDFISREPMRPSYRRPFSRIR